MRWRGWRLASGVAVVLLLLSVAAAGLPGGRRMRTIWRVPWGAGGVATLAGADGATYGPLAFAVGRSDAVLADSFAHRLLLVPLNGGPVQALDLGPGHPLVDELAAADGTVFLAGGGSIWRWQPPAGRLEPVAHFSGDGHDLALVEGLAALPVGHGVAVDLLTLDRRRATRSIFILEPGGQRRPIARLTFDEAAAGVEGGWPGAVVPAGRRALAAGPGGAVYLLGFARSGRRTVFRYGAGNRAAAAVRLPAAGGRWSLLGVDRSGRIYLGVDLGSAAGRVFVLSPRGRVVFSWALPLVGDVRLGAYVAVAANGDLYVLDPAGGRLTLRRWRVRRRLVLAGAPAAAA